MHRILQCNYNRHRSAYICNAFDTEIPCSFGTKREEQVIFKRFPIG